MLSHSEVSDSLRPHELQPTRLLCPWNSLGKNIEAGCHSLLQGIFLIQGLNFCLLRLQHGREDSLPLSHLGRLIIILTIIMVLFNYFCWILTRKQNKQENKKLTSNKYFIKISKWVVYPLEKSQFHWLKAEQILQGFLPFLSFTKTYSATWPQN